MTLVTPLPESQATDKVAQTYSRVREMLGTDSLPEPWLVYGRVPAFLQDFYMNFKKFCYSPGKLDEKTKALVALAVASSVPSTPWIESLRDRLGTLGADGQAAADAMAVAATCGMYNAYYKFADLSGSDLFGGMSAGLRAHTFSNTSLDETTVELINIAISDVNGCKPCTVGHVKKARELGVSDEAIHEVIQCASTMVAGARFLTAAGF